MPDSVPNYLHTNADGTVGAVFPGGVLLDRQDYTAPVGPFVIPSPEGAISWERPEDGTTAGLVANVRRTLAGENVTYVVTEGKAPTGSPFAESQNRTVLRSVSPDGTKVADSYSYANNAGQGTAVSAGGSGRTVFDSTGSSNFMQWASTRDLLGTIVSASVGALASGIEAQFALAVPWTTTVVMMGGLAGADAGSASAMLCTWSYNPNTPGNINLIIRNNSPFGMASGATFVGTVFYK